MSTTFFQRTLVLCALLAGPILTPTLKAVAGQAPISDYKIEPLDTLAVDVLGETNLCRECKVQATGEISYPFFTNLVVAGSTAGQVAERLKVLLGKDYLVNPQVTVTVKQYRERTVSVVGEVNKPGALVIPEEQKWSIPEAIAHAGGFTKLAKKRNQIRFTRNGGEPKTYDFDKLLKDQEDPGKVISLQAGDLIKVLQSTF